MGKSYTSISLDAAVKHRLKDWAETLGLSTDCVIRAMTYEGLLERGIELHPETLGIISIYHRAIADHLGGVLNPEILDISTKMLAIREAHDSGQIHFNDYIKKMKRLLRRLESTPLKAQGT